MAVTDHLLTLHINILAIFGLLAAGLPNWLNKTSCANRLCSELSFLPLDVGAVEGSWHQVFKALHGNEGQ